jgi:hypothetical protein
LLHTLRTIHPDGMSVINGKAMQMARNTLASAEPVSS